jgi:hypothetical protein
MKVNLDKNDLVVIGNLFAMCIVQKTILNEEELDLFHKLKFKFGYRGIYRHRV